MSSTLAFTRIIFTVLMMFFATQPTYASSRLSPVDRLQDYISKFCKKDCVDPQLLLMTVKEAAEQFSINPITLIAIIRTESGFRPKVVNTQSGRSVGLSQIQVYWHKAKFRSTNYTDIFDNVYVAASIYADCVKKWPGSREKALWCYNGHQKKGFKTYVPKVLAAYQQIEKLQLNI